MTTVALTFNEYGQPNLHRHTVVLLHPFPFDGRLWHEVAASTTAVAQFVRGMSTRLLSETTQGQRPEVVDQVQQWIDEASPHTIAWLQHAMADRPDSVADLAQYAGPALLVRGAQDLVSSAHDYEVMANVLPDSTMVTIDGCGHLPPVEDPAATCSAITNWLATI